jgi:hypothetical protein
MRGAQQDVAVLLENGIKVLVFSGDADFCINWIGSLGKMLHIKMLHIKMLHS